VISAVGTPPSTAAATVTPAGSGCAELACGHLRSLHLQWIGIGYRRLWQDELGGLAHETANEVIPEGEPNG
jgi:hypothetical protein